MNDAISSGVLVGFSGGPDSVFLLEFLNEYRKKNNGDFKILAVHVNHSIRGDEADSDESFSREYAKALGIEFISKKVDATSYATCNHQSLEEAARNLRYSVFAEIIQGRTDVSTIAVAHNANDNFETVIFNMMRGAGLKGISGITPIRGNIIRPILSVTKSEILSLLSNAGIKFAVDSTNFSLEYSRNYIRHKIIPTFSKLSSEPENMLTKLSETLRQDNDFIENAAKEFYVKNAIDGRISVQKLNSLHPALKPRILLYLASQYEISLERVHISKILELLPSGNFKTSLPGGYEFIAESGECYIDEPKEAEEFSFQLTLGENKFEGFDDFVIVSNSKVEDSSSNVYKIAIQAAFNFDIINTVLSVRNKKDGDAYRYDGMTRKLKKLFNDKSIPPSRRFDVPVICDDEGILWVPGFKVRDGAKGNSLYIAICSPNTNTAEKKRKFCIIK